MSYSEDKQFFLVKEDIKTLDGKLLMKKGELGQLVEFSTNNGYFIALRLKTNGILEVPYAPAFIQFIGNEIIAASPEEDELFEGGLDE